MHATFVKERVDKYMNRFAYISKLLLKEKEKGGGRRKARVEPRYL